MQTQKRKAIAKRQAHIAAWRQSQLSKSQYCAQHQINYQTFLNWTKQQSTIHNEGMQKFLQVELTPSSPSPAILATLTFANQITVQLHQIVSASFLKQLIASCK